MEFTKELIAEAKNKFRNETTISKRLVYQLFYEIERLQAEKEQVCEWKEHLLIETSCGHDISSEIPYMVEAELVYCPMCGKRIKYV